MTDCIVSEYDESSTRENFKGGISTTNETADNDTDNTNTSNDTIYSNKSELEKLIDILKKGIKKNEPGIKYIKYPSLLVNALEELNHLIGMDRLKDSVAVQTVQLIERMKAGEKTTAMLNCMLCGPPGVGKTKAGTILAKIWFALGFLNAGNKTNTTTTQKKFEIPPTFPGGNGNVGGMDMSALVLLLVAWLATYAIQVMSFVYNQIGWFWLAFILGFIVLIIIFVYYGNSSSKTEWIKNYIYEEKAVTEEELKNVEDKDIITIVSRDSFVAHFLGQTASKTKALLEANIGKVVFIDEAYSLINDPRDAYGYECLNTLNLFLSENPDKIVVIFAGYKDMIENSIFTAQPGLKRRCMYRYEMEAYSGEELADIFFLQAEKDGWKIEDKEKIKKLIMRNESAFPAYGGSTEQLVYLSSLESTRHNLTSNITESFLSTEAPSIKKEKILTYKDVEKGLISLKENK